MNHAWPYIYITMASHVRVCMVENIYIKGVIMHGLTYITMAELVRGLHGGKYIY